MKLTTNCPLVHDGRPGEQALNGVLDQFAKGYALNLKLVRTPDGDPRTFLDDDELLGAFASYALDQGFSHNLASRTASAAPGGAVWRPSDIGFSGFVVSICKDRGRMALQADALSVVQRALHSLQTAETDDAIAKAIDQVCSAVKLDGTAIHYLEQQPNALIGLVRLLIGKLDDGLRLVPNDRQQRLAGKVPIALRDEDLYLFDALPATLRDAVVVQKPAATSDTVRGGLAASDMAAARLTPIAIVCEDARHPEGIQVGVNASTRAVTLRCHPDALGVAVVFAVVQWRVRGNR